MCIPDQKETLERNEPSESIFTRYMEAMSRGTEGFDPIEQFLPFQLQTAATELNGELPDLIIDLKQEGRIPLLPEGKGHPDLLGLESRNIATLRARLMAMSLKRPGERNRLRPKNLEKRLIDYFARRFLRIPYLYHYLDATRPNTEQRQYELVRRVLEGQSILGIMPTGSTERNCCFLCTPLSVTGIF